jgi:BirA family transcriptional regulator, biotin operon repressor / biotin---[acetyl-CoA-carboxylase] ligase
MEYPLADEILRRLLEAGGVPVSGQKLARALGVTRAAIWKSIQGLRRQGYPVESLPALGYRLEGRARGLRPGELASRLRTKRMGRSSRHLERLDSTSREAERWARESAPEGALVVAERQDAGRGRLGRSWHHLPGKSLLFSLVLRPPLTVAAAPLLTYAAAVALARAFARWVPTEEIEIKWPNDVLLQGRKVAGILLEVRAEGQAVEYVILGIGINVEGELDEFPEELRSRAGSVAHYAATPPGRLELLCAVLEEFETTYDSFLDEGFPPLRKEWNEWFRMARRAIQVQTIGGTMEGVAVGLGENGALLLEAEQGLREVYAGDVELAGMRD